MDEQYNESTIAESNVESEIEYASNSEGDINSEDDDIEDDNIADATEIKFSSKEILYYNKINKFFKALDEKKVDMMINIINKKYHISLRLLDWFITRYSAKYKVRYTLSLIDNDMYKIEDSINVHIAYKAQLKTFRKKYFDPFRRRKKFYYYFDEEKTKRLCTTICQLNFFKWAFDYNIIDYVEKNFKKLSKAMIASNRKEKRKSKTKGSSGSGSTASASISTVGSKPSKSSQPSKSSKKVQVNLAVQKKVQSKNIKITLSFD